MNVTFKKHKPNLNSPTSIHHHKLLHLQTEAMSQNGSPILPILSYSLTHFYPTLALREPTIPHLLFPYLQLIRAIIPF